MSEQIKLNWIKCTGNLWCNLLKLNLSNSHFDNIEGVYVIWHGSPDSWTVRVGQGNIKERLGSHKDDPDILVYSDKELYVTWARVSNEIKDGVEKFLYEKLKPLVGERCPDVLPLEVNLPW